MTEADNARDDARIAKLVQKEDFRSLLHDYLISQGADEKRVESYIRRWIWCAEFVDGTAAVWNRIMMMVVPFALILFVVVIGSWVLPFGKFFARILPTE